MSANPEQRRPPVRSVALIVLGSIVGLLGLGLLASGGGALWGDSQRDSHGYFTRSAHRIATDSYAVTHDGVDVNHLPGFLDNGKLARIRIAAATDTGRPVFVGIARERDAQAYLANVAHSDIRDYGAATADQEYDAVGGTARPLPPASQHIWVAPTKGSEPLKWRLREGDWSVVLMNADGSKGVAADVKVGAKFGYFGWAVGALFTFGAALLALGAFLAVRGGRRGGDAQPAGRVPAAPAVASSVPSTTPASIES